MIPENLRKNSNLQLTIKFQFSFLIASITATVHLVSFRSHSCRAPHRCTLHQIWGTPSSKSTNYTPKSHHISPTATKGPSPPPCALIPPQCPTIDHPSLLCPAQCPKPASPHYGPERPVRSLLCPSNSISTPFFQVNFTFLPWETT